MPGYGAGGGVCPSVATPLNHLPHPSKHKKLVKRFLNGRKTVITKIKLFKNVFITSCVCWDSIDKMHILLARGTEFFVHEVTFDRIKSLVTFRMYMLHIQQNLTFFCRDNRKRTGLPISWVLLIILEFGILWSLFGQCSQPILNPITVFAFVFCVLAYANGM